MQTRADITYVEAILISSKVLQGLAAEWTIATVFSLLYGCSQTAKPEKF
jgi:hypothetical protein